jgi:hypothetical protein
MLFQKYFRIENIIRYHYKIIHYTIFKRGKPFELSNLLNLIDEHSKNTLGR